MSRAQLSRLLPWAAMVAVLGLVAAAAGAFVDSPRAFFAGWLTAYFYWLGLPLTALSLLMIHDLAGGGWGAALRPLLEAATATLPLFALLFLPIPIAGLADLYGWARPDVAATLPNAFYLNLGGFAGRAAAYYVLWLLCAVITLRRARSGLLGVDRAGSWVSGVGLVVMAPTVTFASFDWIMSLEPRWSSSMFGMIIGSSEFITGFAILVLIAVTLGPAARDQDAKVRGALGSILIVAVIFWAYTDFVQFLEVWEENLMDEIPWYLHRFQGGWLAVAIAEMIGRFALPFLLLIWTPIKRSRIGLGAICAWLVPINLLYIWWLVLPLFFGGGMDWFAVASAVGAGGLWFAAFLGWFNIGDRLADRWLVSRTRVGHA